MNNGKYTNMNGINYRFARFLKMAIGIKSKIIAELYCKTLGIIINHI